MNRLRKEQRAAIVRALIAGNSIRSTVGLTGFAKNTVASLLLDLGVAVAEYQDKALHNLRSRRIQAAEIWAFCGAKKKTQKDPSNLRRNKDAGDVWTWAAIDADSKLCVSWIVGPRDAASAYALISEVRLRMASRIQLTADQPCIHLKAANRSFGLDVDYAVLQKVYAGEQGGRHSPAEDVAARRVEVTGALDQKHISTSFVERSNLNMRMYSRRPTRLTNGLSRKLRNHATSVALYFMWYNFGRIHQTLRVTPAMEAGVSDHVWTAEEIVELLN